MNFEKRNILGEKIRETESFPVRNYLFRFRPQNCNFRIGIPEVHFQFSPGQIKFVLIE